MSTRPASIEPLVASMYSAAMMSRAMLGDQVLRTLDEDAGAEAGAWAAWRRMRAKGLRMSDAGNLVRKIEARCARLRR